MFKEINTLKIFFEDPNREYSVREAGRRLKITPATASKKLKEFAKLGVLKHRKANILDLYSADLENEEYRDLKVYYNIRKIKRSGLIKGLNEFYLKPTIVLFGSMANGYDAKESDIDLLIISENKKEFDVSKYNLGKEVQLFVHKSLSEIKNKHLVNNILNGITLQGSIWI